MTRLHAAMIAAGFAGGVLIACADRQVELEDMEFDEEPACIWLWGTGYWDDGGAHQLVNDEGLTETVCVCMTPEEQWHLAVEDEQAFIDSEINALGFEACKRVADPYAFDSDPCQELFETGNWQSGLGFDSPNDDVPDKNREGLVCGESDVNELGCSLGARPPCVPWLLAVVGAIAWRRRSRGT